MMSSRSLILTFVLWCLVLGLMLAGSLGTAAQTADPCKGCKCKPGSGSQERCTQSVSACSVCRTAVWNTCVIECPGDCPLNGQIYKAFVGCCQCAADDGPGGILEVHRLDYCRPNQRPLPTMSLKNNSAYGSEAARTRGAPLHATTPLLAALLPIAPTMVGKHLQDDRAGMTSFVAKFTTTSNLALVHPEAAGESVNEGTIARDRFGRIRQESFIRDREGKTLDHSVAIFDGDRTLYLHPAKKLAFEERNVSPGGLALEPPNKVFRRIRELGTQTIRGIRCVGTESAAGPDDVMEVWVSVELDYPVLRIHRQPDGLVSTFALTEIRVGEEPDPRSYEAPADYRFVNEVEWRDCCARPHLAAPQQN